MGGDIGCHRVVTTKLPMASFNGNGSSNGRNALISSGSSTTRLLGTFQKVEQVFLVGVGGGVPHYTDFDKHVRKGDVVISSLPPDSQSYIYEHCSKVLRGSSGREETKFETRSWCPPDLSLQKITQDLVNQYESNPSEAPWLQLFANFSSTLENNQEKHNGENNGHSN